VVAKSDEGLDEEAAPTTLKSEGSEEAAAAQTTLEDDESFASAQSVQTGGMASEQLDIDLSITRVRVFSDSRAAQNVEVAAGDGTREEEGDLPGQQEKIVISEVTKRLEKIRRQVSREIEEDLRIEMTYPVVVEERKNRDHQNRLDDGRDFRLILDQNTKTDSRGVVFKTNTTVRMIDEEHVIQAATTITDGDRIKEVEHEAKTNCVSGEEFERAWAENWRPVGEDLPQSPDLPDADNKEEEEALSTAQSDTALEKALSTAQSDATTIPGKVPDEQGAISPYHPEEPRVLLENEYSGTPAAAKQRHPVSEDIRRLSRNVRDAHRQSARASSLKSENIYEEIDGDVQSIGSGDYSLERMEKFTDDANEGFEASLHSRMALPLLSEERRKRELENTIEDRTFSQELIQHTLVDANGVKFVFVSNTRCIHDMVVVSGQTIIVDGDKEETEEHPIKMGVVTDKAMVPMSNKNLKDFDKIWNANWVPARKDVHADHLKKVSFA